MYPINNIVYPKNLQIASKKYDEVNQKNLDENVKLPSNFNSLSAFDFLSKIYKLDLDKNESNHSSELENVSTNSLPELPNEVIDKIFDYIFAQPYLAIKSTQQFAAFMLVSRHLHYRVINFLKFNTINSAQNEDYSIMNFRNIEIIHSTWNEDKKYIKELLDESNYIASASSHEQMDWCDEKIRLIARKSEYTDEAIQFLMEIVFKNLRHINFNLIENNYKLGYLEPDEKYRIFNIVFNILLQKTNIESLDLIVNEEIIVKSLYSEDIEKDNEGIDYKKDFIEKLLLLLKSNKVLNDIPQLGFRNNSLSTDHIKPLLKALSGKKIGILSFDNNKIDTETIKIISRYLREMDINYLSINSAKIDDEGALYLAENLPVKLESISLKGNNISKTGAINFFEKLAKTTVQYVSLTHNELYSNQFDSVLDILKVQPINYDVLMSILNSESIQVSDVQAALITPPKNIYDLEEKLKPLFLIRPDDLKKILASSLIQTIDLQYCGLRGRESSFQGMKNGSQSQEKIHIYIER